MKFKRAALGVILVKVCVTCGFLFDALINESCSNKLEKDTCEKDPDCIFDNNHTCGHEYRDYGCFEKVWHYFFNTWQEEEKRLQTDKKEKQSRRHEEMRKNRFIEDIPYAREKGAQCDPYGGPGHCGISSSASYLMNHPIVSNNFKDAYNKLTNKHSTWTRAQKITYMANEKLSAYQKITHPHNLVKGPYGNYIIHTQERVFEAFGLPSEGIPISVNYNEQKWLTETEKEKQFNCLRDVIIVNQEKKKAPTLIGVKGEVYPGLAGKPRYNENDKQYYWDGPSISGHAVNATNYHKKVPSENSDDSFLLDDPNNTEAIRVKVNKSGEVYDVSKHVNKNMVLQNVRIQPLILTGNVKTWEIPFKK